MLGIERAWPAPADHAPLEEDASIPDEVEQAQGGVGRDPRSDLAQGSDDRERSLRRATSVQIRMEGPVETENQEEAHRGELREQGQNRAQEGGQVERASATRIGPGELVGLDPESEQHPEAREHVLASHDPADRLHVHGQQREDAGHRESETEAPGRVAEEEEQERDVQRIEDDVAEVEGTGVLEPEQPSLEGPAHVPQEQRLLAREVVHEDLPEARGERVLVVEVGVGEQDPSVVEPEEVEGGRARVQGQVQDYEGEADEERTLPAAPPGFVENGQGLPASSARCRSRPEGDRPVEAVPLGRRSVPSPIRLHGVCW